MLFSSSTVILNITLSLIPRRQSRYNVRVVAFYCCSPLLISTVSIALMLMNTINIIRIDQDTTEWVAVVAFLILLLHVDDDDGDERASDCLSAVCLMRLTPRTIHKTNDFLSGCPPRNQQKDKTNHPARPFVAAFDEFRPHSFLVYGLVNDFANSYTRRGHWTVINLGPNPLPRHSFAN